VDARKRRLSRRGIQLHFSGEAGAAGSSLTRDPAHDGRGAARVVEKVGWFVCGDRTTVDTTGAVAARVVVTGAVFGAERAAADGTDDYNLLFRWFVGLRMDDEVWDVTVFTKNRDRLIEGEIAEGFFQEVVQQARAGALLSDEHFTVDGTLLEAWANRDSFKEKKDPPAKGTGRRGQKLLRDTHESSTDPEARIYKKSAAGMAKPSYLGHVVTENRNGLIVQASVTQSGQKAEKEAGLKMMTKLLRGKATRMTLGADKGYQNEDFIAGLRGLKVSPHVAEYEPNDKWPNWLTAEERQHPGYEISLRKRKLVENVFGWIKSIAGLRQTKLRGVQRVDWAFQFAAAACNLVRMRKLLPAV